jgi:hypothetical protein
VTDWLAGWLASWLTDSSFENKTATEVHWLDVPRRVEPASLRFEITSQGFDLFCKKKDTGIVGTSFMSGRLGDPPLAVRRCSIFSGLPRCSFNINLTYC